eukprot:scaffold11751_cov159-Amphora_coffeaeformis.AAC.2
MPFYGKFPERLAPRSHDYVCRVNCKITPLQRKPHENMPRFYGGGKGPRAIRRAARIEVLLM